MVVGGRFVGRVLALAVVLGVAGVMAASASAAPVARARPAGGPRTGRVLVPRVWRRLAAPRAVVRARSARARGSAVTPTPITACGTEIKTPGTYVLAANLTDAGPYCVWIATDGVTLDLTGHSITGDGSDTCIAVEDQNEDRSVKDDTITGPGALNGCEYGIGPYYSTRTVASKVTISPGSASTSTSDAGVYEEYSVDGSYSNITVSDDSGSAGGFYLEYGSANKVSSSEVTSTGAPSSFYVYYEYDDTLSGDTASYPLGPGGSGYGFVEYYSNRDTYTGDTATGQLTGFYLYEEAYGIVTADNDSYSNPAEDSTSSYGFYTYEAYGPVGHSTWTGNSDDGGYYGYWDDYSYKSVYTSNTAKDNEGYGFYFEYPYAYTITGNTSDGAPNFVHDADGFYFYDAYAEYAPVAFNNNTSTYNDYGFYSDYGIHGTGNIAKHDTHDSWGVEVN